MSLKILRKFFFSVAILLFLMLYKVAGYIVRFFFLFLPFYHATAMWIGNIADPSLHQEGLFISPPKQASFRIGYLGDFLYRQNIYDDLSLGECTTTLSHMRLWTQAGIGTFNFRNRIDVYGILGASRLQIDQDIFTSQQFSWGVGGKIVIFQSPRLRVGIDLKYFESTQKPTFLMCDDQAYNITSAFNLRYTETQGAAGIAYYTAWVTPYAAASYIIAKIDPHPPVAYVKLPDDDDEVTFESKHMAISSRFGLVIGASLIDHKKASLNLEWRTLNQNGVSLLGEFRF